MSTKRFETTLIPYEYRGIRSGFKSIKAYIVKGRESPDPSHRMLWGYDEEGNTLPGDYKGFFTRAGKPIKIYYESKDLTSANRREDESNAIRKYLKNNMRQKVKA